MDMEYIEQLMQQMNTHGFVTLQLRNEDGSELTLEKPTAAMPAVAQPAPAAPVEAPAVDEGTYITSPMVGTFYNAPSPEDPQFVKEGDVVQPDTVVCIVEAMKVMNEVKAECSGVIREVCVQNGHPVEFGTRLFRVETN